MTIGLISDTHGLLRESAVMALAGSEAVIHAGDIGGPEIIDKLGQIAPVTAVRGNIDIDAWGKTLPETAVLEVCGFRVYVLHDINQMRIDPKTQGYAAVVSGHSHKPAETRVNGVLFVNPGSAGRRRFRLPVTIARLVIADGIMAVRFVDLAA